MTIEFIGLLTPVEMHLSATERFVEQLKRGNLEKDDTTDAASDKRDVEIERITLDETHGGLLLEGREYILIGRETEDEERIILDGIVAKTDQ